MNPDIEGWECSVFNGKYITGDVDEAYLARLDALRRDEAREAAQAGVPEDNGIIDLHNDED